MSKATSVLKLKVTVECFCFHYYTIRQPWAKSVVPDAAECSVWSAAKLFPLIQQFSETSTGIEMDSFKF